MSDQNITEIRKIVKDILKKNNIDPKIIKFKVFYISFQDLVREGKYFVEFKNIRDIFDGDLKFKILQEVESAGKEEDFCLSKSISG